MNSEPKTPGSTSGRTARKFFRAAAKFAAFLVAFIVWIWSIGFAYCLDDNLPGAIAKSFACLIGIGIPCLILQFRKTRPWLPWLGLLTVFGICLIAFQAMKPTHDRDWELAQATLPFTDVQLGVDSEPKSVTVNNIRANRYGPVAPAGQSHYSDTYDLSNLESVWFGVDRFTDVEPLAHTFLSFGFKPGSHRTNYLAFSVETRREKDEELYSPIRGLFNNYELIYVIADEQDVLSVRSDVREHVVQLYPVRATPQQVRTMFLDMLNRANSIHSQPEFYHTLTSNCTNNIVFHTNKVLIHPISGWERGVVFPGYSDWLAYRLGMLDTELSLEEARESFRIDQRVKAFTGRGDFSEFIRGKAGNE